MGEVIFWPLVALLLGLYAELVRANLQATVDASELCPARPDKDSPCVWIGECSVEGCVGTCIVNRERFRSDRILADRAFDESFWQLCPELASLVQSSGPVNSGQTGRRLLQESLTFADGSIGTGLDTTDTTTSSVHIPYISDSSRRLAQAAGDDAAPDSSQEQQAIQYQLACPNEGTVDAAHSNLVDLGLVVQRAFDRYIKGEAMEEDLEYVNSPNKWLTLIRFLKAPEVLKGFVASNCTVQPVKAADSGYEAAVSFIEESGVKVQAGQAVQICADNGGMWQKHHESLLDLQDSCSSPFGQEPSCFPQGTHKMLIDGDDNCAEGFSNVYNVTQDVTRGIANVTTQLYAECSDITVETLCMDAALDPIIQNLTRDFDKLHKDIHLSAEDSADKEVRSLAEAVHDALLDEPLRIPQQDTIRGTGNDDSIKPATLNGQESAGVGSGPSSDATLGEDQPEESSKDGTTTILVLVGALLAIGFVGCAAVAAAVSLKKKRMREEKKRPRHKPRGSMMVDFGAHSATGTQDTTTALSLHRPPSMTSEDWHQMSRAPADPSSKPGTQDGNTVTSCAPNPKPSYCAASTYPGVSFDGSQNGSMLPLPPVFGPAQVNGDTCLALDFLHQNKLLFCKQYEILGSNHRWIGSHGIVQLATMNSTGETKAIKIFTNQQCFANERRIYSTNTIAPALGASPFFSSNHDRAASTPYGFYFPPFIITDKCDSLEKTMRRGRTDFPTVMQYWKLREFNCKRVQLLGQMLKSLKALHEGGYAHRNLKPSNILRRRSHKDWILADFACAVVLNKGAPLPLNTAHSPYTAPEIAAALLPGRSPFGLSTRAADIWALGVIMYELLLNERVLHPDAPCELMHQALVGTIPLPWEAGAVGAEAKQRQLGMLYPLVMPCLSRNYEDRPDAGTLLKQYWHLCDLHGMYGPHVWRPHGPTVSTFAQGTYSTFNTFNSVSSMQGTAGAATVMSAVDRAEVAVVRPPQRDDPVATPKNAAAGNMHFDDSTAVIDSEGLDVAHLHTAQQSSASVPLGEESTDMMLPVPPPVPAPQRPPDARAAAHAASRAAIRKWAEGSVQGVPGAGRAGGSPGRRSPREVGSIRVVHESGSLTDEQLVAEENLMWRSREHSGSIAVGSLVGSVTVLGGSGDLLQRATRDSTPRTSPDGTQGRGSEARTRTSGTPTRSLEMIPFNASTSMRSDGERLSTDSAFSPMRLR